MSLGTVLLFLLSAAVTLALGNEIRNGGILSVISEGESGATYCTNIPYPAAPQTAILLDGQSGQTVMCGSCDPNGRRDAEMKGYHLLLTDTSVLVYRPEDCSLHVTLTLAPNCPPMSLRLSSREHRVYITCDSTPKYMQINYDDDNDPETPDFHLSELLPSESDASAPVNGTFISGDSSDGLRKDDYFLWIADGLLYIYAAYENKLLWDGYSASNLEDVNIDCDTLTAVYAMNENIEGEPRFRLGCVRDGVERLYEVTLHSGESPRELQPLTGSPIASPDGEFFVVVKARTRVAVYETSDTSHFAERNFGVIEEARFEQLGSLTLVVRGEDIRLVNVTLFFSSGGTNGTMSLPGSATNCPAVGRCLPHGFVRDSYYLVMTADGNAYEGRVYDLTDRSYTVVGSINGRPEAASFMILTPPTFIPTPPTSTTPTSAESPTSTTDNSPSVSFEENNRKRTRLSAGGVAAIVTCLVVGLSLIVAVIVAAVFRKTISQKLRNAKYFCLNSQEPVVPLPEEGRRPSLTGASTTGTPIPSRAGTPVPVQATASDDESANSHLHSRSDHLHSRSDASSRSPASSHHHAGSGSRETRDDTTAPLLSSSGHSSIASSRQSTPIPPQRDNPLMNLGSRGAEDDRRSESSPDGRENGTPALVVSAATSLPNYPSTNRRNLLSSGARSEFEPGRELLLYQNSSAPAS